jgi:hypothetical protein
VRRYFTKQRELPKTAETFHSEIYEKTIVHVCSPLPFLYSYYKRPKYSHHEFCNTSIGLGYSIRSTQFWLCTFHPLSNKRNVQRGHCTWTLRYIRNLVKIGTCYLITPSIPNYKSLWLFWFIYFAMYLNSKS